MSKKNRVPAFSYAVPEELGIPPDPLRLRLDFHHETTEMTLFQEDTVVTKLVDAMDVAHALASDLSFGTGLLPAGTLWWNNTRSGPVWALYAYPKIRTITLQADLKKKPRRFTIPLPGFVFLCRTGQPPRVFAVKSKPTKETDILYHAPFTNTYQDGRTCPGSQKYPTRVADIVQAFFISFFSHTGDRSERSKQYPKNIIQLWESLDGKKKYPLDDLVACGRIADIVNGENSQ